MELHFFLGHRSDDEQCWNKKVQTSKTKSSFLPQIRERNTVCILATEPRIASVETDWTYQTYESCLDMRFRIVSQTSSYGWWRDGDPLKVIHSWSLIWIPESPPRITCRRYLAQTLLCLAFNLSGKLQVRNCDYFPCPFYANIEGSPYVHCLLGLLIMQWFLALTFAVQGLN